MRSENWHPILRLTIYTNKKCGVIESRNRFTNAANWFSLAVQCGVLSWNSRPHIWAGTLQLGPHPQSFFVLVVFHMGSGDFHSGWPETMIFLWRVSYVAGIRDMHLHTQLICQDELTLHFCPHWPWTTNLLISTSRTAEIIEKSHHPWL
jgi:hypothetical protein